MTNKYHPHPVARDGDGYEQLHEPLSDEDLNRTVMWTVYEDQDDGTQQAIADFFGDSDADDAKAFAEYKNNQ
jgi:hypothetical protein